VRPAIIGISGQTLTPEEESLLASHSPAGVILFARNVDTPPQLRALTTQLRARLPEDAAVMVDQ